MTVLQMSDVWLSFRPRGDRGQRQAAVWGLRDVNLDVAAGECVAIMGQNGCGKSTLLRVASGIYEASRGQVVRPKGTSAVLDLTTGQNRELSGYQALDLFAAIDGQTATQWRTLRPRVVEATQLAPTALDRALSTYSLGMLLRLQLALALCYQRDLIVIDEVLAAADGHYLTWACRRIADVCRDGTAVVLASHDEELVRHMAQRVVILDKGGVDFVGSVDDALRHYHRGDGDQAG